jgi:hypothetical protein
VLIVLGAWFVYRGRFPSAAPILVVTGAVLVALGLVWPRALVWPNRAWMALAEVLAFVSTRVVLGAVFLLAVTPIGIVRRLIGSDPLQRRAPRRQSYWQPYSARQRDPKHFERMF